MWFGKRTVLGLDLGEYSLKCASVEPETGRVRALHEAVLFPERQNRTEVLEPALLEDRVRTALAECRRHCTPWSRHQVVSLPARAGACGYQEFPPLSGPEMSLAVPSKVSKLIPFPLSEVSISHVPIPLARPAEGQGGIFYVAVQKGPLQQLMDLLRKLGLRVRRAELPPLSLAREFHRNHPELSDSFHLLVNLGFRNSTLTVVRGGYPYHARGAALGSADFTYALQMGAQSTWEQAEASKRAYDHRRREPAMEPFLHRWMEEVRKTLVQAERRFSEESCRVRGVFLSGGEARTAGLAERLSETLKLPVQVDSWAALQGPANSSPETFKVAVGLALGD